MSTGPLLAAPAAIPVHPPDELASWERIRRYAVPRWMIERAGERRLAGDWRGACAAAGVDITFDLDEVAGAYGGQVARRLEEDLRHFAPDLVRWHLPRVLGGRTTLATKRAVVLAEYPSPTEAPGTGPCLHLGTPAMVDGPQRLVLAFDKAASIGKKTLGYSPEAEQNWRFARYLWDARESAELRHRIGGGKRAPFFHPDGTALTEHELPTSHPGHQDPAALTEWVTLLQTGGDLEAACAAAGVELDPTVVRVRRYHTVEPLRLLAAMALNPSRLIPEVRRLTGADTGAPVQISRGGLQALLLELTGSEPGLRVRGAERVPTTDMRSLPEAGWRWPPDLDLLRTGRITPEQLHPLVRSSLLPGLPSAEGMSGPPDAELPGPTPVRCRGEWHEVATRDGALTVPHTAEEQRREQALRAFGGTIAGCFLVREAWVSGTGRLPRALREQRRDLFLRVQHGDAPGLLRLLDAGADPLVRDGRQRTLLHVLHLLDHERLLPRLMEAGLDLEAKDHHGRTPLHVAVGDRGSSALVQALLGLGARIDVVDQEGWGLGQLIRRHRRSDLRFLMDRVEREHPDLEGYVWLTEDDWDEENDE